MSDRSGLLDISPARRAAEEQSRARVYAAKLRFDLAVAQREQLLRQYGPVATKQATAMEEEARREYQRELQIFANLIVRGEELEDQLPTALEPEAGRGPTIAE